MIDNWWTRAPAWAKVVVVVIAAVIVGFAMVIITRAPKAHASPIDVNPPIYCPGGGITTGWGGYCDGNPYPDGTRWHSDSFWAPVVGLVWRPAMCVRIGTTEPAPGGCGQAVAR